MIAPVICVVEGRHDIEFLCRISTMLHADDPQLPDLREMERRQEIVFMPCGGGDFSSWSWRLSGLDHAEFHLLDRDVSPVTEKRQQWVNLVNARPHCRAVLTQHRSLENYIHPAAILEVSGLQVTFSANDHVANLIARQAYERHEGRLPWESLLGVNRKRRRAKVKAWLSTLATERMTPQRLAQQDPADEVRSWLETIARLAKEPRT